MRRTPRVPASRLAALLAIIALPAEAAPSVKPSAGPSVEVAGAPVVVFDSARDGCPGGDMPDVNPRAYRDAAGSSAMFALHDGNRPLRGPDLAHLKPDCRVALASPEDADPARYADRNFVAATWTDDGRAVDALVHHEYHADHHGRCTAAGDLACWYNTVLAYRAVDGGAFARRAPLVVAAAPFRQDQGQGRQRGFFNPSNIVGAGRYRYALIATTGWGGQPDGACLFRTPAGADAWRAFDGAGFTVRYADPYAVGGASRPRPCRTLPPFGGPVGSLALHRASGTWIAVFQAKGGDGGAVPVSGIYYALSRDLTRWGAPRLLLASPTLYDDPCRAGPTVVNYPALLDPATPSRNYDEVGDHPELWYAIISLSDCRTGQRLLVRRRLAITLGGPS